MSEQTISVRLSEDAGQTLQFGSDGGLLGHQTAVPDPLLIADGSLAAPSLAFADQPGLGLYRVVADQALGITGRLEVLAPGTLGFLVSAAATASIVINSGPNNPNFAHLTYQRNGTAKWRVRKGLPIGAGNDDHFEIVRIDDSAVETVSMRIMRTTGAVVLPELGPLVLDISADANNALVRGSDNRFFVPTQAPPTLVAGDGIAVAGLTISAALSADANNAAAFGSDNGLFVPPSPAPDPAALISADPNNALVAGTDSLLFVPTPTPPTAASFISADADNQIGQGTDNLLYVAAAPPQIQGSVPTVADLPATGEVGQYWIVEADGNLYAWTAP